MHWIDAYRYGTSIFPDVVVSAPKKVVKGYTKKQVQEIADDAANKTAASWKKYSTMYRLQKKALAETINHLVCQGRATSTETYQTYRSYCRQFAQKEGFDLESAESRWNPHEANVIACRLYDCKRKESFRGAASQKDAGKTFIPWKIISFLMLLGAIAVVFEIFHQNPEQLNAFCDNAIHFFRELKK